MGRTWSLITTTNRTHEEVLDWCSSLDNWKYFERSGCSAAVLTVVIDDRRTTQRKWGLDDYSLRQLGYPRTIDFNFWPMHGHRGRRGRIDEIYKLAFEFCRWDDSNVQLDYEGEPIFLRRDGRYRINRAEFQSVSRRSMLTFDYELSPWPFSYFIEDGWPASAPITERESAQKLLDLYETDTALVCPILIDRLKQRASVESADGWWSEKIADRDPVFVRSWIFVTGSLGEVCDWLSSLADWKPRESSEQTDGRKVFESDDGDIVVTVSDPAHAAEFQGWGAEKFRPTETVVIDIALNLNSKTLGRYDEIFEIAFEFAKWDGGNLFFYVNRVFGDQESWKCFVARRENRWSIDSFEFEPASLAVMVTSEHDFNQHGWVNRVDFLSKPIDESFELLNP